MINKISFENNYIKKVLRLTIANWFKISVSYLFVFIITTLLLLLVLRLVFGSLISVNTLQGSSGLLTSNLLPLISGLYGSILKLLLYGLLFTIINLIITSWQYNFSFVVTELKINNSSSGFGMAFQKSFNAGVFKILAIIILYLILIYAVILGSMFLFFYARWTILITGLALFFILAKSILVLPAFVVGKKSFGESFVYSFSNITVVRVLKLFLAGIVILLTGLIIYSIPSGIFYFMVQEGITSWKIAIPVYIIQIILQIILYGFFTSFFTAAVTALYYRYEKNDEPEQTETQETSESNDEPYDFSKNLFA